MATRPVALVTGAARRIGRALVVGLAKDGFDVVVHYRSSATEAAETAARARAHGARAEVVRADLACVTEIEGLFGAVGELFGQLHLLVNNASSFARTPFGQVGEAQFDEMLDSNLKGPFFCCQFGAALMQGVENAQIVNLVDVSAERPWPEYLPYCVAKAGLVALTRGLARRLAPAIRVNGIAPGPVLFAEHFSAAAREKAIEQTLLGRAGSVRDVVAALRFLVHGSDFVTGVILPVDGGRSLA